MKLFSIYFCVLLLNFFISESYTEVLTQQWESFKVYHNKTYSTIHEDKQRFKTFAKNLERVNLHNSEYEKKLHTFKLDINQFSDMTQEEINGVMNGVRLPFNRPSKGNDKLRFVPVLDVVPEFMNWTEKGAVTHVKNQGHCGSCWAFATTGALEGQLFVALKQISNLSEQNLIDCSKKNHGCGGGWMETAFQYIKDNNGIDSEIGYPYEGAAKECRYNASVKGATDYGYVNIPSKNEQYMKQVVATRGPIAVAIDAGLPTFHLYKNGVYKDKRCRKNGVVNHAVLIVGYGVDNDTKLDYWLVKNSWSPTWGDNGYFKIARNINMCSISMYGIYPKVENIKKYSEAKIYNK